MAKFQPGNPGRPVGSKNRLSRNAREAFQAVYDRLGGDDSLAAWAIANPDEFFKLYARLISVEVSGPDGGGINVIIQRFSPNNLPAKT